MPSILNNGYVVVFSRKSPYGDFLCLVALFVFALYIANASGNFEVVLNTTVLEYE